MKSSHQATLGAPVSLSGIGVHSGKTVNLHLHPAQAGHGIVFLRTGLRQAHFGEISLPVDHDELLHNRPGLDRMLAAGTWGLV